jgi:4,5-dihydroxyphthalate decarboxylase
MGNSKPVSVAVWRYDRTQALYDGRVRLPNNEMELIDAPLEDIFSRAFEHAEFDVSELSFSNFLRLTAQGKCPYIGIPIFPSRSFRHSAFYVHADANITSPKDLIGRKVGVREYSMTAALAARGALRDQFGVKSEDIKWVTADMDEKEREHIALPTLYKNVDITIAEDRLLNQMLLDREIDAMLVYKPPAGFKAGHPKILRLFPQPEAVEEQYFRETGVFPIMHLMGIRKDIASSNPNLARDVFNAFSAAQRFADDDLELEQALKISLPWLAQEVKRTKKIMGDRFWATGMAANRKVINRMIDWSFEDGLLSTRIDPEDLFAASLHKT